MRKRIEYLDYAKGILVLSVIIGHIFQDTFISKFIYNFHMMAFFFISGIQFNYSTTMKKPMPKIVMSRICTMMIPFCFFEIWGCITYIFRFGFNQNINGFIYNAITLNFNNGVLWFLFTLFVSELLFMAIMKIPMHKTAVLSVAIVLLGVSLIVPLNNNYTDYLMRSFRALFFITCGYYSVGIIEKRDNVILFCCFAILLCLPFLSGHIGFTDVTVDNVAMFLLGSFSGTYMVIQLAKRIRSKMLLYIGQNTLAIFATHNCYYLLIGDVLNVSDFRSISVEKGLLVLVLVLVAELPTVYLLNKYFPVFVGKKRTK